MEIPGLNLSAPIGQSMSRELLKVQQQAAAGAEGSFESVLISALNDKDDEKLKDACVQFEEMMIGMLYKQMKATIIRADEKEKDPGRDVYEQWQDEALVKEMAKNGSFGLADMMYKQLAKRMKNEYILAEE